MLFQDAKIKDGELVLCFVNTMGRADSKTVIVGKNSKITDGRFLDDGVTLLPPASVICENGSGKITVDFLENGHVNFFAEINDNHDPV